VIRHPNAIFIPDIHPLARHMCPLAERAVARGEYQDVAYFEPFYLKEFIAIKSKNLL
jgi:tRNA threonylcarbamoyladenosine biosynthesis protein TsaB